MKRLAALLGRWQPVLFLPLFSADTWERGTAGPGGLVSALTLSVLVVVGLLLVVMASARRCETNSEAARRAWSGGADARTLPQARVIHPRRR